ncbi:MAG: polyprenyl synthetase family protein [Parvularculaceae bacterium]
MLYPGAHPLDPAKAVAQSKLHAAVGLTSARQLSFEVHLSLPAPSLSNDKASMRDSFRGAVLQLQALNRQDMSRVNETILENMQSSVALIPQMAEHLIAAGGKRLRPLLTLSAARGLGYDADRHIHLAAAVELIHAATLLHDDVVDESALRRGAKTANIIWGNKESVLVGDFLFSRAFELMVKTEDLRVLDILSNASGIIAEGEVMQLSTQKNIAATQDMYLNVIKAKTAALFAAATRAGAVIAGASPTHEQALYTYGLHLGIAYQMVDDALDYAGSEVALGKSVGDDFKEGKMTLPVVLALQAADAKETSFWTRTISDGAQEDEDFTMACALMARHGTVEKTLSRARTHADTAVQALEILPNTQHFDALIDLADLSVGRVS